MNLSAAIRERSIFGGIGREFMQTHGEHQRGLSRQREIWTIDNDPVMALRLERLQGAPNRLIPVLKGQQVIRLAKRMQAGLEGL
jgi:hypothetical protein